MNANIRKISEIKIIALMTIVCMLYVCVATSVSNGDGEESAHSDSSFFITYEDLGISECEMNSIFQSLGFNTIYILTDDNGEVYAETSVTTDSGRNGIDRIHDGIRIYLSSESVQAIMNGGAGALGAILGSLIAPGIGSILTGAFLAILSGQIIEAIMDGLDWNNGITIDVKLYKHRHFMGVTFKTPVKPEIKNINPQ